MFKPLVTVSLLAFTFGMIGCSTDPKDSPTAALIAGNISSDKYLNAVTKANQATNEKEQFEINREPTRAYNTKTKKFEYVPKDTQQHWNEKNKRWEFTPVEKK